jgi:hypothetical protein
LALINESLHRPGLHIRSARSVLSLVPPPAVGRLAPQSLDARVVSAEDQLAEERCHRDTESEREVGLVDGARLRAGFDVCDELPVRFAPRIQSWYVEAHGLAALYKVVAEFIGRGAERSVGGVLHRVGRACKVLPGPAHQPLRWGLATGEHDATSSLMALMYVQFCELCAGAGP